MAAQQNGDVQQDAASEADLAQAFKDLARGERTAAALENHLDALEAKIEELLASADAQQNAATQAVASQSAEQDSQHSAGSNAEKES